MIDKVLEQLFLEINERIRHSFIHDVKYDDDPVRYRESQIASKVEAICKRKFQEFWNTQHLASRKRTNELLMAEHQLLGFCHAQSGFDIVSLVEAMGLTSSEFDKLEKAGKLCLGREDLYILREHFK